MGEAVWRVTLVAECSGSLSVTLIVFFFLLMGRAYIGSLLSVRGVGVLGGRGAGDPDRRRIGGLLGGFNVGAGWSRRSVEEEVEAPLS